MIFKQILCYISVIIILENSGFASSSATTATSASAAAGAYVPVNLSTANKDYMTLMLGDKGINDTRGTDVQLRQMIDGAITTGITDRLYNFGDRLDLFKAQVADLTGRKRLHVQLAYAFYVLGYYEPNDIPHLKDRVLPLCGNLEPNFDKEFTSLCTLAYSKDSIFVYKNLLEDVIKRASQPLRFKQFAQSATPGTLSISDVQADTTPLIGGYGELVKIQNTFLQFISQQPIGTTTGSAPEIPYISGLKNLPPINVGDNESLYIHAVLNNIARLGIEHAEEGQYIEIGLKKADMRKFWMTDFSPLQIYNAYVPTGHSVLGIAAQELLNMSNAAPLPSPPPAPALSLDTASVVPPPPAAPPPSISISSTPSLNAGRAALLSALNTNNPMSGLRKANVPAGTTATEPDARTALLGAIRKKPKLKSATATSPAGNQSSAAVQPGISRILQQHMDKRRVSADTSSLSTAGTFEAMTDSENYVDQDIKTLIRDIRINYKMDTLDEWDSKPQLSWKDVRPLAENASDSLAIKAYKSTWNEQVEKAKVIRTSKVGSVPVLRMSKSTKLVVTPSPSPAASSDSASVSVGSNTLSLTITSPVLSSSSSSAPVLALSSNSTPAAANTSSLSVVSQPAPPVVPPASSLPDITTWAEQEFQRKKTELEMQIQVLSDENVNVLPLTKRMARRKEIEESLKPLNAELAKYNNSFGKDIIVKEIKKRYPFS